MRFISWFFLMYLAHLHNCAFIMAIQKISLQQFLQLGKLHPVLDVRSPGEYAIAHMPNAYNLPLFSDEERKVVGTAYKQQSREKAIKIGLDYFGVKMRLMVEEAESLCKKITALKNKDIVLKGGEPNTVRENCILVHCWRGGMRSAGVAWLLDLYGFKVYSLAGGYKTYREWVRLQFEQAWPLVVLGGYTGSGKTLVIHQLLQLGHPVIDLENLANHKGSAFGSLGEAPQPKQEMFENLLAEKLVEIQLADPELKNKIYIEDESQRIGALNIPPNFWIQMRSSPIRFLEIPFEERLTLLTEEYGRFNAPELTDATIRIQKRLGPQETKKAIEFLELNDKKECFRILLKYYDKYYERGLNNRDNLIAALAKIPCLSTDAIINTQKLIDEY